MPQLRFTVTLSAASTDTVQVGYATSDGTALAGTHYTAKTGTLVFAAGELSKDILVQVIDGITPSEDLTFNLTLTDPTGATILDGIGIGTIPASIPEYLARFKSIYNQLHDSDNGYFGPQTGTNAFAVPRHIPFVDSKIINEAPDYGGETVSETASFWVGLEAWNGYVTGQIGTADWTPYNNAWNKIDQFYVPSDTNQPIGSYTESHPADYVPEGDLPSDYPRLSDPDAAVGSDPLYSELQTTYGTKSVYLMHWIIDVEGDYGFRNGDGNTKIVYINTYERGMQESSFETVTHPCWNDWSNGGGTYGYEPLYTQGTQLYPAAPFDYAKKWGYTNAPDAEARAIQWSYWANKFATEQSLASSVSASSTKSKKMGDYLRYNLFDKYFRKIGDFDTAGTGYDACHYLINWYASWGGEVVTSGVGSWSYRIGSSECHQGYQAVNTAYFMATGGGGFSPLSASAGDIWLGSLYRQIEMIRWLQSPEGPIAGGVTNSLWARYETATDGREDAKFYGMYYTYSPVWHDPPSNNWVGLQAWGQGRTADLFLEVSDKTTSLAVAIRPNLEIILNKLVHWILTNTVLADGTFTMPSSLSWVSTTEVSGQTTTAVNKEGVYEYLPSLEWDGTGDYSAFWNESTVPNPNLHCTIAESGTDLGVAASTAYMLIAYAQAKRNMGKFTDTIPNSTYTAEDAFNLAKELLDRIWANYRDSVGISIAEKQAGLARLNDEVYVPSTFTGTMPNGETIASGVKFIELRTFLQDDPKWADIQTYIDNPIEANIPIFTYHRFWANSEYAMACAALHRYFSDLV